MAAETPPRAAEAIPGLPAWLQALYDQIRSDPMGGMGVLFGNGVPQMQMAAPKLAQYLQKVPARISVEARPVFQLRQILDTLRGDPLPPGELHGFSLGSPSTGLQIRLAQESMEPLQTAAHEGLHTAYRLKPEATGYPPSQYWPTLLEWAKRKGLLKAISGQPGEDVIDALASNILLRGQP